MDLNNFGPAALDVRLLFEDLAPGFGPPINQAVSTNAVHLPALSGWTSVEFGVTAADLTAILGTASDALMNTDLLRIFHNPIAASPPFIGPPR